MRALNWSFGSPRRNMWIAVWLVLTVAGGGKVDAKCPFTLTQAIGEEAADAIRKQIETAERKFRRAENLVPEELARTASENLPLLRRADFLNPVWPGARIYVDSYYADDADMSSPDRQILRSDEGTLCLLLPG